MNLAPKSMNTDYEGENGARYISAGPKHMQRTWTTQKFAGGRAWSHLPTGVDSQTALFVVKIACLIARLLLQEWDKQRIAGKVSN